MSKTKRRKPVLKVVFDTNVIYTGNSSDLLNEEVSQIIKENSNHEDLEIKWYIPDIVLKEREYQMRFKGKDLLPAIKKLEKLLGHNLAIDEDILESKIKIAIDNNITNLSLEILKLDTSKVNWDSIIHKSSYRIAPFEHGEKEKGFRDAMILESFIQLIESSPTTPKVCRIALVTRDNLLTESSKENTNGNTNVRILSSLEELKGLINTLVEEIDEEFVKEIIEKATVYFFGSDEKESFYSSQNIGNEIKSKFLNELNSLPFGADRRENTRWIGNDPSFVNKKGQRITLSSRITVKSTIYKTDKASIYENPLQQLYLNIPEPRIFTQKDISDSKERFEKKTEKIFATGETIFEVIWSISVSTDRKLSRPKKESINFIETKWNYN